MVESIFMVNPYWEALRNAQVNMYGLFGCILYVSSMNLYSSVAKVADVDRERYTRGFLRRNKPLTGLSSEG